MLTRSGLVVALMLVASSSAMADEPVTKVQAANACFDVIPMNGSAPPYGPILVNKCTGVTWLLTKAAVPTAKGKPAAFTFQWAPLAIQQEMPVLSFPTLKETLEQYK